MSVVQKECSGSLRLNQLLFVRILLTELGGYLTYVQVQTEGLFSKIELDSLRQWQLTSPVNGVSLTSHVSLPAVGTCFAATASLFFATECATNFCPRGADVDVGDTTVGACR